jgi:hypothetical protein
MMVTIIINSVSTSYGKKITVRAATGKVKQDIPGNLNSSHCQAAKQKPFITAR